MRRFSRFCHELFAHPNDAELNRILGCFTPGSGAKTDLGHSLSVVPFLTDPFRTRPTHDLVSDPEHAVLLLVDKRAGHRNRNIAEQEQR